MYAMSLMIKGTGLHVLKFKMICMPGCSGGTADGAQIYDRKLVIALQEVGVDVETIHLNRRRSFSPPFWQGWESDQKLRSRLEAARRESAKVVISHENYFGLAHGMAVDGLIVHNYLPCFTFPRKPWLESYYHFGAQAFFRRAFDNAATLVFLSHRDHRHAVADFPDIAVRSHVIPPPARETKLRPRRVDLIHVSGSEGWLPKRLSRLTREEANTIARAGFSVSDFGERPYPAFGLITDRFSVGFKLKLMQMLHIGDAIASLADVREEIEALAPGYPFWREVSSVGEAVEWFRSLRDDLGVDLLDQRMAEAQASFRLPNWAETGQKVADILEKRAPAG